MIPFPHRINGVFDYVFCAFFSFFLSFLIFRNLSLSFFFVDYLIGLSSLIQNAGSSCKHIIKVFEFFMSKVLCSKCNRNIWVSIGIEFPIKLKRKSLSNIRLDFCFSSKDDWYWKNECIYGEIKTHDEI